MAEQENASVDPGFPRELLSQPIAARYTYFEKKLVAHPLLKEAYDKLLRTIYQPAGASLVWAIGPTGVGKTTLLRKIVKQIIEDAMKDMERDPGFLPIVNIGLQDVSTERGTFDWKDFFKCFLRALNEPLIERKIDYVSSIGPLQKSLRRTSTLADLRSAAKECVRNGSGTNKQDMVDCEGQSVLKKEEPFMVTITVHCPHCQSDALVRNGHAPNGKQLYCCRACGRQSRENPTPHAYPQARREEILHAYQERSSLRGLTRTFGVSRTTVSTWIKKK